MGLALAVVVGVGVIANTFGDDLRKPVKSAPTSESSPDPSPSTHRSPPPPRPRPSLHMTRSLFITALDGVWADLQRDLVEPLEDGHYWIDSVDVLRLDISGYEITADITTIVPGGYYSRERDELESATWEFVSNWARFAWLSFAESAQGETSSNTIYDWSDLTPGLRLVLDGGEHTVTCPGSFVWSVAQRMAGRSDFESTCTIL